MSIFLVSEVTFVVVVTRVMRIRPGMVAVFSTGNKGSDKKMFLKNMSRVNVNVLSWVAVVLSPEPSRLFSLKLLLLMSCEYVFS